MNDGYCLHSPELIDYRQIRRCAGQEPSHTPAWDIKMFGATRRAFPKSVRSFLSEEKGTSTIEFVVLLPLFTMILLLVADASMLFLRHTSLMNVSRDAARIVARHGMTPAQAKGYAENRTSSVASLATAEVTIQNGFVTVVITADSASSAPFGIITFAVGDVIAGRAISTMEPI